MKRLVDRTLNLCRETPRTRRRKKSACCTNVEDLVLSTLMESFAKQMFDTSENRPRTRFSSATRRGTPRSSPGPQTPDGQRTRMEKWDLERATRPKAERRMHFRKMHFRKMHFRKMHVRKMHFRKCIFEKCIFRKFCKFLAGLFSAVSKRIFARKYAFDRIFQVLQDLHAFAPLQSQNFSRIIGLKNQIFL